MFLSRLLSGVLSHDIQVPGPVETFIDDYSRQETLDPDWKRMQQLFIRTCNEYRSTVYVVVDGLECVPANESSIILDTISKMWDSRRCKLLLSMAADYYTTFLDSLEKALPEPGTSVIDGLRASKSDIATYITARLDTAQDFVKEKQNMSKIVETLGDE